jgi:hypothetical protein
MFQLYKKRDFNLLVSDTFNFFKLYGKNYFKNYLIINGGFLLVLVALIYFFIKIFYEGLQSSVNSINYGGNPMYDNLYSNATYFAIGGILAFILICVISIVNYTYPIAYLKLIEKNTEQTTKNLIDFIKSKIGKSILFFLGSLISFVPIFFIAGAILIALSIIIIGIPLMVVVIPTLITWVSLSYYDYISNDHEFFTSVGNGYNLLVENFWSNIGSTVIMFIIVNVVLGIVYFIPYIIGMASIVSNQDSYSGNPNQVADNISFAIILMSVILIISILFNYILQNLIFINQGIIYYSSIEEKENFTTKSNIDLIGTDSE